MGNNCDLILAAASYCGEKSDYKGNDIGHIQALSFEDCQQKCKFNPDCKFVSFVIDIKECFMKTHVSLSVPTSALISGPKDCGKLLCFFLSKLMLLVYMNFRKNVFLDILDEL